MEPSASGDLPKLLAHPHIDGRIKEMMKGNAKKPPWFDKLGSKEGLSIQTHEIQSQPDGNAMEVMFIRPEGQELLPCVLYMHGGGMAMGDPFGPPWSRFGRVVSQQGVCVALPDFRNFLIPSRKGKPVGKFPAGLNDCMSALQWINQSKTSLGIGERVLIAGESGGGNLAMALALKCKREGKLDLFQGFYALCPFIAGYWPDRPGKDGEILGTSHMQSANSGIAIRMDPREPNRFAMGYSKTAVQERNPLAWPGFATEEDVRGLPAGVISVDECDPLRDEGINFFRLLLRANVPARCVTNMGHIHGGHLAGFVAMPEHTLATARAIADEAKGVPAVLAKL